MILPKRKYYNDYIRCYPSGTIERLDKRYKNPQWREVKQTWFNKDGYLLIQIGRKNYGWHRIIYTVFKGEIPKGLEVNHIDEDKANNAISNLNLMTRKENCSYGTRNERVTKANANNPLRSKKVLCVETGIVYPSIMEVARQLGLNNSNVSACCRGERKTCGGFHWEYVEE